MSNRTPKESSFFRAQLQTVIVINVLSLAFVAGLLYSSFVDDYKDNLVDVTRSKVALISSASASAISFASDGWRLRTFKAILVAVFEPIPGSDAKPPTMARVLGLYL